MKYNNQIARKYTKLIVGSIIRSSVSGTVVTLIHANTPTYKKSQKAQLYIGAATVGWLAADRVTEHMDKEIDKLFDAFEPKKVTDSTETPTE